MFTARSEFRLSLRSDNADLRLTQKGYDIGCVGNDRYEKFIKFKKKYDKAIEHLTSLSHSVVYWKSKIPSLAIHADNPYKKNCIELLRLEGTTVPTFENFIEPSFRFILEDKNLMERIKIYSLYHENETKQANEINEIKKHESINLPDNFDYNKLSISNESKEKLFTFRPTSLGAAMRVPGK
jgi:tRNA uridine 5-carboxymethylaminomethyl modification enzyme